jgi:hypothetical protein
MPDDIEKLRGAMQSSANIILSLFQDAWEIFRDDIGPQTVQELLGDDTEKIASEKTIQFVRDIVRHPKFSDGIGALEWQLRTLKDARHDLLTSDRPVTYTRPLEGPQAHLVVPVGPQTLFIAARPEAMKQLMAVRDDAMATVANMSAVQNASSYVFGTSDSQLRFVQNRFGSSREQTIMDQSLVLVENLRREFEGVKLPIDLGVLKKMAEPFVQARRLAELE